MWILTYIKSSVGKGLLYKKHSHIHVDVGYVGDRGDKKFTTNYLISIGGNLMTWRSKKQGVVSRPSPKAFYRAMTPTTWELMWLNNYCLCLALNKRVQCLCIVITPSISRSISILLEIIFCTRFTPSSE